MRIVLFWFWAGVNIQRWNWTKLIMVAIHDNVAEGLKLCTGKWLCKKISHYVASGTIADLDMSLLHTVNHRKISCIHVSRAFTAWCFAICFEKDQSLIILVDYWWLGGIPLLGKEIWCPQHWSEGVMYCHNFGFGWACQAKFLLCLKMPLPMVMKDPLWLHMSSWTAKVQSIHRLAWSRQSASRVTQRSFVLLRYLITLANFCNHHYLAASHKCTGKTLPPECQVMPSCKGIGIFQSHDERNVQSPCQAYLHLSES